jgi:tetratricopeptide (TPR) repeat protein
MRFIVIILISFSLLNALGERPKATQSGPEQASEVLMAPQQNEQKDTADAQYLWIIQNYEQARRDNYDKSIAKALQATDYFINNYSADERLPMVYFYSAQLNALSGDTVQQEAALTKYFSVATTDNPVYLLARVDRASLWERAGKIVEAVQEYEDVYAIAPDNTAAKDKALLQLVPSYEAEQQWPKLKAVYAFFIDNPEKLPNPEMYYIYAYKLGVIHYNEGNKNEAEKYFAIVKSGNAPVLKLFKESIETKYK